MANVVFNAVLFLEMASVIALFVFGVILNRKLKIIWSMILLIGLFLMLTSELAGLVVGVVSLTSDQVFAGNGEVPIHLYVRKIAFAIGLLTAAVGFAGTVLKIKQM